MNFTEILQNLTKKPLADCTDQELYLALLELVRQKSADRVQSVTGRKLYYISAEFLIGKLLSNNLINLGLYEEAREALAAAGKNLSDIEEVEPEPSLGNGGLGRLAACFLDSLATLNLPGDGVGLRYHFGLFHQSFENDPERKTRSMADCTQLGRKNRYNLSGRTGRQRIHCQTVQTGSYRLRRPHQHPEPVRPRHHRRKHRS